MDGCYAGNWCDGAALRLYLRVARPGRLAAGREFESRPPRARLSSSADVVSDCIEHQHHHVDHTVTSHSFWAVHPRHQELVGGGHDTEAKQKYIALLQRRTRREEAGDQLGGPATPCPSLSAGNGPAAEPLPRLDAGLIGIFLV